MRTLILALVLLGLAACGAPTYTRVPAALDPRDGLDAKMLEWNCRQASRAWDPVTRACLAR